MSMLGDLIKLSMGIVCVLLVMCIYWDKNILKNKRVPFLLILNMVLGVIGIIITTWVYLNR